MLRQRVITGVILLCGMLAALFLAGKMLFTAVISVVVLVGAWEWARFMGLTSGLARGTYVALQATLMAVVFYVYPHTMDWMASPDTIPPMALGAFLLSAAWWMGAFFLVKYYPVSGHLWRERYWLSGLMGVCTLIPAWLAIIGIRNLGYTHDPVLGASFLLFMMAIVWVADIGAYFAGKRFGKRKLAPNASPGKTIEGAVGGLAISIVFAYGVSFQFSFLSDKQAAIMWVALVIVVVSIVGDLTESIMKREQGLKDSGQCLPGHGGVLDRIDSLAAASPCFALCVLVLELTP